MTANSDKSKQDNKAAHRVLAGVLCGASVLSLVLSLVMPPISQAIANDTQTVSSEETVMGGGSSSDSAAVGNTSEDVENRNSSETDGGEADSSNSAEQAQNENAASAGTTTTVEPGIHVPTSIGIGTNINVSTPDPGVATYVGRDMYIGGKPSNTSTLDASNAPTGSYAAEAEGLTVVRGKLAMNPIKGSWGGHGFRFGTVGFGSQFRPSEGSTVLAVAGIDSAITSMSVGYSGDTPQATTVGAWTKGAWVGKATTGDSAGYEYTAQIAGPITYWNTNKDRQSVVKTQGHLSDDGLFSNSDNGASIMSHINGKDYANYLQSEVKANISTPLANLKATGGYEVGVAEQNPKYMIKKYNNKEQYGLTFDDSIKTFKRKTNYTDVNGNSVSDPVILVNNEKLIKFTGDADESGNGSSLQVFYLKASDLTNSYDGNIYRGVDFSFDKIPTGASVVVNIIDEKGQTATPVEFNTGWRFWWNGEEISRGYEEGNDDRAKHLRAQYSTAAQSILWNFATASQVTIRGGMALEGNKDLNSSADGKWTDDDPAAAMLGSIVVPNGSFEDHVTTNGRVYVGGDFEMYNPTEAWEFDFEGSSASVIDMDQERHNFPWSGSYTPDGSSIAWSKVDSVDSTLLKGSVWAIYGSPSDAVEGKKPIVKVIDGSENDYASDDGKLQFNYLNQKANIGDPNDAKYFTYYIKEVTAPEGYQVSDKIYYASMNNAGETVNYVQGYVDENGNKVPFEPSNTTGAISNTKITGTVSWTKVEEGAAERTPLTGSEWKLAKLGADGSTEEKSWTVSDRSTASEVTWEDSDDAPGKFTLEGLLPGTYTLVETQAPLGYELNENTYKFTVDSTNGSIKWEGNEQPSIVSGTTYISDKCSATSVTIPVTKSVRNTDWPKGDDNYVPFEFSIEATGDYAVTPPMPKESKISVAPEAGETDAAKLNNITVAFGAMTFNKSHLSDTAGTAGDYAKTYTYTVKEVAPTTGAIDKLRYSKAEYQVAVTVKADMDKTTGKRSGLTTSTTVTQVKDDMGNTVSNTIGKDAAPDAIPASTFTNVKVLTDLPLTGAGWTENSMLLVGAGLMLLGGIAAGAYWFATKRRQDDPSDGAGR